MKRLSQMLALAGLGMVCLLGGNSVQAQERPGRGNFDPEQFRQRMMERFREQLEVKSDEEWKVIQGRIQNVLEARREAGPGGPRFGFGFGRPDRRGGGDDNDRPRRGGGPRGPRGSFGGGPAPEVEALQQALESNASADELKSKLEAVRQARKEKETKLDSAQQELRKLLTIRQEANAVLMGLLD